MNYLDKLKIAVHNKEFWRKYLPLLAKSIRVVPNTSTPYKDWKGVSEDRDGYPWASRANRWKRPDVFWYNDTTLEVKTSEDCNIYTDIPLFPNYAKRAMEGLDLTLDLTLDPLGTIPSSTIGWEFKNIKQENNMKDKLQNTANAVLDQNKIAAKLAGKLSMGKTANHFFLSKLAGKLPWYAKFFGKKNELQDNPVAKLVR
jgi:hypothetical protein